MANNKQTTELKPADIRPSPGTMEGMDPETGNYIREAPEKSTNNKGNDILSVEELAAHSLAVKEKPQFSDPYKSRLNSSADSTDPRTLASALSRRPSNTVSVQKEIRPKAGPITRIWFFEHLTFDFNYSYRYVLFRQ